jgi:cold-inducible RNA-binding protein
MKNKLFVGNISPNVSAEQLAELFSHHGTVKSVELVVDRTTGLMRGFGFVLMNTARDARAAIEALNGTAFGGRALIVNDGSSENQGDVDQSAGGLADAGEEDEELVEAGAEAEVPVFSSAAAPSSAASNPGAAPAPRGASRDLSKQIAQTVVKKPGDVVKCTRVTEDMYRCNWWAPEGTNAYDNPLIEGLLVTTHRVRKSRFLYVTKNADRLVIVEADRHA